MPVVVRSEFALALNQVATERGIDPEVVLETIRSAILAAYRKDYGLEDLEKLTVEVNPDNGEAKIFKEGKDITPPGFGRIAAQTAKQVILQRIREAEKQAILTDYQAKIGTIISGMVLRFDGPNIVIDIGRAQAAMPPQEQIPNEKYRLNQRLSFYIEGIRETHRGNQIIVSRAHEGLIKGLFKREVPEVAQGAVDIREIAREPGIRTKIAVFSEQSGVDPVGSCVGQKGVRVMAVINELGGIEKIDIIQWHEDPKQFIMAALSPATDLDIVLNKKTKEAKVTAPDDQLSLAIGRDGQNVRLAARLAGWKIDIQGKGDGKKDEPDKSSEDKSKDEEEKEKDGGKKPKIKKSGKKVDKKTEKKDAKQEKEKPSLEKDQESQKEEKSPQEKPSNSEVEETEGADKDSTTA